MEVLEKDELYHIGHHVGKQGPQSPVGSQAGIEKLVIRTKIDLSGNDPNIINETTAQIYGVGIHQKKTTATAKSSNKPLVEMKPKTYYCLRTMAKKIQASGSIVMPQYITLSTKRRKIKSKQ